jgi:hypothetical protein
MTDDRVDDIGARVADIRMPVTMTDDRVDDVGARVANVRMRVTMTDDRVDDVDARIPPMRAVLPKMRSSLAKMGVRITQKAMRIRLVGLRLEGKALDEDVMPRRSKAIPSGMTLSGTARSVHAPLKSAKGAGLLVAIPSGRREVQSG